MSDSAAPTLPTTIIAASYRLLRLLGEGGMGTVYEAQHLRLNTRVALKILSPALATDPTARERFKREARAASQIRHPHVVQITDYGETPNSVFFAMELLEGRDLHRMLREHGPLPWRRARDLLLQAASALGAAHARGVVHRDVKPANVFVLEGEGVHDFVKILDFGIAKIVAPHADSALAKNLTGTGEIFGTARYMAPEQAYGTSKDPRVDVYSLGVVAYEMLTGRVPFTGDSGFEIVTRHVYERPRPPQELQPSIPTALEAVVLRALEKQPQDRFESMEAFADALRAVDQRKTVPMPAAVRSRATEPAPAAVPVEAGVVAVRERAERPAATATPTKPRHGESGRMAARGGPTPGWRLWAFASIAALCVSALSAAGAYLAVVPTPEPTTHAQPTPAPSPPPEPILAAAVEPATRHGEGEPSAPEPSAPADEPTTAHDRPATTAPDEPNPPSPEPEHGPPTPEELDPTPPPIERRPRPNPRPKPQDDEPIGMALAKKVMRKCKALGVGRKVAIVLHVDERGRVKQQEIDAKDPLASCVAKALGRPSFSGQHPTIKLNPRIGDPPSKCNDPFLADDPQCKPT